MKSIFVFLFLVVSSLAYSQYPWPPEGDEGVDYFMNEREKADGLHYRTYGDGALYYMGKFKNGKPQPKSTLYYYTEKGKIMTTHTFGDSPSSVSAKNFHLTGALQSEGQYESRLREGEWKFYNEDEKLIRIERYKANMLSGNVEVYFPSGRQYRLETYVDSVLQGDFVEWFEDGKIKLKGGYLDGDFHGDFLYNYETGEKLLEGKYVKGAKDGLWREYNRNLTVRVSYMYVNSQQTKAVKQNGEFEEFYANGIPQSVCSYKNGKLHGAFEEWYDKGEFVKIPMENASGPLEYKQTLEGAQIQREGEYVDGKLNGDIFYYAESGELIKTEVYKMGELVESIEH